VWAGHCPVTVDELVLLLAQQERQAGVRWWLRAIDRGVRSHGRRVKNNACCQSPRRVNSSLGGGREGPSWLVRRVCDVEGPLGALGCLMKGVHVRGENVTDGL